MEYTLAAKVSWWQARNYKGFLSSCIFN